MASAAMDLPSSTIDPAALDPAALVGPPPPHARGLKRSRSPDHNYDDAQHLNDDDLNLRKKRGRPTRKAFATSPTRASQPPPTPTSSNSGAAPPVQTPQPQNAPLPQASPLQVSPSAKSTPTKPAVIKALPTVRDHTTDQLNPEGDEFLPREIDEAGERKVTPTGHPLDGREYRCRTFFVPNRGDKLFMLATECARVLGYRDSYLLFNKNRSLFKIIATQAEKDDLIHQEILPYSYRSRQIAIVTARSMFRQFGSRLVANGRRVRDDYWETKAKKQGFTEEDAAGEKRPGAAKAREAAAAEANHASAMAFAHSTAAYSGNNPDYLAATMNPMQPFGGLNPAPGSVPVADAESYNPRVTSMTMTAPTMTTTTTMAMTTTTTTPATTATDVPPRDYSGVQRPRHEITGTPYQDTTRPTPSGEILNQAAQTAEINKQFEQHRKHRKDILNDIWTRPHDPPPPIHRPDTADHGSDHVPHVTQAMHSPRAPSANNATMPGSNQYAMPAQTPLRPGQSMGVQSYRPPSLPPNNMVPSPMGPQQHTPIRPDPMQRRAPSIGMPQAMSSSTIGPGGMLPGVPNPSHGYPPSHMWQGPPQPSPLSQQHNMQQYAHPRPQQSPLPQHSPMHASPQLHHAQSSVSMHGTPVQQYQTLGPMSGDAGYPAMSQNPYQPSPSPHQYMSHQSAPGQQPGLPGWAPPQQPQHQHQHPHQHQHQHQPPPPPQPQQQPGWQSY